MKKLLALITLSFSASFAQAQTLHTITTIDEKQINEVCLMNIIHERFDYAINAPAEDSLRKPVSSVISHADHIKNLQSDPFTVTYFNEGIYFYATYLIPSLYFTFNKETNELFQYSIFDKPGINRCIIK